MYGLNPTLFLTYYVSNISFTTVVVSVIQRLSVESQDFKVTMLLSCKISMEGKENHSPRTFPCYLGCSGFSDD